MFNYLNVNDIFVNKFCIYIFNNILLIID